MAHLQMSYQPAVIKELLENNGPCTEEQLIVKIREHDPNKKKQKDHRYREVFDTEVIKKVTKRTGKVFSLNYIPKNDQEKNELIKVCDEWISNVKDDYSRKKYGVGKLVKFLDKVDKIQLQVLEEILRLRGKTLTAEKLRGSGKGGEKLKSRRIDGPYTIHYLNRGTYAPAGSKYAQAIYLSPKTKWGKEIDPKHPTLRINYDYSDSPHHQTDMNAMRACKEIGLPIGLFFRLKKDKFRCLGLGKITSIVKNNFVIDSFGITEEESKKLKDDVLSDYNRYYERQHKEDAFRNLDPVNWEEFSLDLAEIERKARAPSEIAPGQKNISNILYEVNEGSWLIPEFQRTFKWKINDVVALLNSVFKGYYIGSFLLWNVDESTKDQCWTFPIEGAIEKESSYNKIILDGQQRITSLNYAINAPEKTEKTPNHPGYFYIDCRGFLLDNQDDFVVSNKTELEETETFNRLLFPFKHLENPNRWIKGLKKFLKEQDRWDEKYEEQILDRLRDKTNEMKEFKISTIELNRVPYDLVGNIFEIINTAGKTLDLFDLMNNRMNAHGIKLRDLWQKAQKKYPKITAYNKKMKTEIPRYIMESISLSYSLGKSCKRADILDMFSTMKREENWTIDKFTQMWNETLECTNDTIKILEDNQKGFGVPSPEFLPYEPMFPVLTSLIQQIKNNFKDKQISCDEKLRKWYWASVFDQRYSQGVEGRKTSDYKLMIEWFKDDKNIPKFFTDFENDYQRIPFEDETVLKSARYTGVLCLIMKKGASDPMIRFSDKNKKHIDHIFPKSKSEKFVRNSILNMTWLTDITNITKLNKMPKEYYAGIRKKHYDDNDSKLRKVLSSHLINDETYDYLLEDKFEEFLEARRKEILKTIANETGIKYVDQDVLPTQTSKDTPYANVLAVRNAVRSCNKEIIWVSKYWGEADLETLYKSVNDTVKKIRILLSKKRKDIKSDFKRYKDEKTGIECEMRVMSKKAEEEIHGRYLVCPDKCYNMIDTDIAKRGQTDDISLCTRPKNLENWWEDSYDIFRDWNKFQD